MKKSNIETAETVDDGERVLRASDLMRVMGLGRTATYTVIKNPDFPKAIQLTGAVRGWLKSEVVAWLKSRQVGARND